MVAGLADGGGGEVGSVCGSVSGGRIDGLGGGGLAGGGEGDVGVVKEAAGTAAMTAAAGRGGEGEGGGAGTAGKRSSDHLLNLGGVDRRQVVPRFAQYISGSKQPKGSYRDFSTFF